MLVKYVITLRARSRGFGHCFALKVLLGSRLPGLHGSRFVPCGYVAVLHDKLSDFSTFILE